MATAEYSGASFDGGLVTVDFEYNTATFLLESVVYQNLSTQDAKVTVTDPQSNVSTFVLTANTASTSANLKNLHLTMSATTGINPKTGLQQTFVNLPTGWSISCAWPD